MKLLKYIFIGIPNIPLILMICIYVVSKIFKNTGIIEMSMLEGSSFLTSEIKEYLSKMFPKIIFESIALFFWLYILSIIFI